ncbi:MAG: ABC transporter ATP-binding protein/permease [Burkholderiales bacterium]|nr:ABC transporter ATP-binding protein/permease [Burkholderiales bacterium]
MRLPDSLARFHNFLRQVARLSAPYFSASDERWRARGLLAAIVALNLGAVYMLVQINEWNRVFYDALQNKDAAVFWTQLGRFTLLAMAFVVIAVYRFYLTQLLQLRWRAWMTRDLMGRWLQGQAFYRMELARYAGAAVPTTGATGLPHPGQREPDNPDQRLQEDVNLFTAQTVGLSMGLLNAVVTLASFVGILWGLSGAFSFTLGERTIELPGFMVWLALLYCIAGSVLTHYIGRPLIGLNFEQQKREADFRHHLVRVREYSEAIALDRGEQVEQRNLDTRFGAVLANYLRLIGKQKQLVGFTNLFGQAAVVFPFIVAAPRFFSGAIQLGELMQIASAFDRVQGALSWFVTNYAPVTGWCAIVERLAHFGRAMSAARARADGPRVEAGTADTYEVRDLRLSLPDGRDLLHAGALSIAPGAQTLIEGSSGSGKTTLLRAIAGLWPFGSGAVHKPAGRSLFLPQRAYFPLGSLKHAVTYPLAVEAVSDAEALAALSDAGLAHLAPLLHTVDAWERRLSGGEQQRLALARALLYKPDWLFLDEATSALDRSNQERFHEVLRTRLPATTVVAVAHHRTQTDIYDWVLEVGKGSAHLKPG